MSLFQKGTGDSGSTLRIPPAKHILSLGIGKIALAVVAFLILWTSTTSVPTGHVGVLTLFGRVTGEALSEGLHMIKLLDQTTARRQSVRIELQRAAEAGRPGELMMSRSVFAHDERERLTSGDIDQLGTGHVAAENHFEARSFARIKDRRRGVRNHD